MLTLPPLSLSFSAITRLMADFVPTVQYDQPGKPWREVRATEVDPDDETGDLKKQVARSLNLP